MNNEDFLEGIIASQHKTMFDQKTKMKSLKISRGNYKQRYEREKRELNLSDIYIEDLEDQLHNKDAKITELNRELDNKSAPDYVRETRLMVAGAKRSIELGIDNANRTGNQEAKNLLRLILNDLLNQNL